MDWCDNSGTHSCCIITSHHFSRSVEISPTDLMGTNSVLLLLSIFICNGNNGYNIRCNKYWISKFSLYGTHRQGNHFFCIQIRSQLLEWSDISEPFVYYTVWFRRMTSNIGRARRMGIIHGITVFFSVFVVASFCVLFDRLKIHGISSRAGE